LQRIGDAVRVLRELQQLPFDDFSTNTLYVSTAERQLQVAIQAAIDIGEYLLAHSATASPTDYADVFAKLASVGVIPATFGQRLARMAHFRSILVHMYLEVDLEKVYDYLQNDLADFEEYARYVVAFVKAHQEANER